MTKTSSSASQFKVPFLFEKPLVSEVWKLPALCDFFNQPETRVVLADQCRFGTPWRHRTRFLAYAIADEDIHRLRHLRQASAGLCWSLGVHSSQAYSPLRALARPTNRTTVSLYTSVPYALTAPWHTSSVPSHPPPL